MTNDEVVLIGNKARIIAKRIVGQEDAEDIANDVVETVLSQPPRKFVVKYLVIDAIRKRFGKVGAVHQTARYRLRAGNWHLDALKDVADQNPTPSESMESWECYEKVRRALNPIRRCIITLLVKYGFTASEIADCFNKTDSWVSIELKNCGHSIERLRVLRRKAP